MNQYEALCLFAIRNSQTSRESRHGEWRGLQEWLIWKFCVGRKRFDEGRISVVSRHMGILEFDPTIDESIRKLTRDMPTESVAKRCPGQAREKATFQDSVKIQNEIEATIPQLSYDTDQHPNERQSVRGVKKLDELTARKNQGLIDDSGRIHDTGRSGLDQPGDMRPGIERSKSHGGRKRANHVAQSPESDDQNPIGAGRPRRLCRLCRLCRPITRCPRHATAPLDGGPSCGRCGSYRGSHKKRSDTSPSGGPADRIRSMRISRTLSLYVMRESLFYCALAFFVLTLVLLTQNLLRRLDQLFLIGLTAQDLLIVLECVLPMAISYSIPIAFLVGVLLSVRRLGADGEVTGLSTAGIGPLALLLPYLALGLVATGISAWLLNSVEHESRRELVQLFKTAAARGAILEPGKFREIGKRVVFIEDRDRDGALTGVMILDQSHAERPFRIFADHGRFQFNQSSARLELKLWNGDLHFAPTPGRPTHYERIRFEEFSYELDVGHILGGDFGPVRPKQMSLADLRLVLARAESGDPLRELDQRDPLEYELEIHRRRTLPFAPLLFAGVAVPVALASENRGRSIGLLLVLSVAFGYYALSAAMESLAQQTWISAAVASWIPNILFATLGLGLALYERRRIPA